jgi:hypothetical protein
MVGTNPTLAGLCADRYSRISRRVVNVFKAKITLQKFGKGVQLLKNYQTHLRMWLPVHIIMLIFANSNFFDFFTFNTD